MKKAINAITMLPSRLLACLGMFVGTLVPLALIFAVALVPCAFLTAINFAKQSTAALLLFPLLVCLYVVVLVLLLPLAVVLLSLGEALSLWVRLGF